MPRAGFERPKTGLALDRAAIETGAFIDQDMKYLSENET
jgi:hypothetical protein